MSIERVVRLCDQHRDARALRLTLLDEIRSVVRFEAYSWLLTDPETEVGVSPLADVPCLPELPRLIRLKYLTTVNRWTALRAPVALLRATTIDRPEQSLVWRELLAGYGVSDVASMVFRDRFGCWAFLELWRMDGTAFTQDEADWLAAIAAPVTGALRRCQAATFSSVGPAPERLGPVVLVLSPDLAVRAQTSETDAYLRRLVPPAGDREPVPAGAYNVAAQLVSVEHGVDEHAPTARVHLGDGRWLTLRAARIGSQQPVAEQDIAVTIEAASATERASLLARSAGLSDRERELLMQLIAGADTRQIAQTMFLSEYTVQDHLKSVFAKTGTRSRRTLLARAVGP